MKAHEMMLAYLRLGGQYEAVICLNSGTNCTHRYVSMR